MSGSEAHAFAVLRPAGDNLARAAEELLAAVVGSFDVDAGGPALAELRHAAAAWRDAINTSNLANLPAPPPGKESAVGQAISAVDITIGEGTAWTETGAHLDGAAVVVLTVIVGAGGQEAYEAGELDELHFVAPWPAARAAFDSLARKIRNLPR